MSARYYRLAVLSLGLMAIAGAVTAAAAGISVPPVGLAVITMTVTPQDLAPASCAGMGLTQLMAASGTFTVGHTLILGSSGADTITGGDFDCILGGGGDDVLVGGAWSVLDGGPGTDSCTGGPDATEANCE